MYDHGYEEGYPAPNEGDVLVQAWYEQYVPWCIVVAGLGRLLNHEIGHEQDEYQKIGHAQNDQRDAR